MGWTRRASPDWKASPTASPSTPRTPMIRATGGSASPGCTVLRASDLHAFRALRLAEVQLDKHAVRLVVEDLPQPFCPNMVFGEAQPEPGEPVATGPAEHTAD